MTKLNAKMLLIPYILMVLLIKPDIKPVQGLFISTERFLFGSTFCKAKYVFLFNFFSYIFFIPLYADIHVHINESGLVKNTQFNINISDLLAIICPVSDNKVIPGQYRTAIDFKNCI